MARQARHKSNTGVYHAILRGINKQQIFECEEDYKRFIVVLRSITDIRQGENGELQDPHCVLYAYCLMGNHVHLLIKEGDEPIGETMKRISSSYVYYYNHKYNRIGHLFQERFKSQTVDNWEYFLILLRYIHQNPLKPKLVNNIEDYPWSSWNEYLNSEIDFINAYWDNICKVNTVLKRISLQSLKTLIEEPLTEDEEYGLLDIEPRISKIQYTDSEVWELLEEYSGATNATQFQAIPRSLQKYYLYCIHEVGVGPRTLSRLTGVPYSIVQRATSSSSDRDSFGMLQEPSPEDQLWQTYCDETDFMKYPEY